MNHMRSTFFALSVALATPMFLAMPEVAHAQERDLEKAKESYKVGKAAYDSGDFLTAAEKFVESYEFSGRDELLFNIGQAFRQGGALVEAEKYFQQYLQAKPDAANADDVVNFVIEIQQQIAAEYGTVEFKSATAATVEYGPKKKTCQTPCTVTLRAGELAYSARAEGFQNLTGTVKLEPAKTAAVALELVPIAVKGFVRLESDRPARLVIDGQPAGSLPLDGPLELDPGVHAMELVDGDKRWAGELSVEANETVRMMVPLDVSGGGSSWKQVTAYVLGGTGVAFAVGGVLMGLEASSTYDTLDAQQALRGYADQDLVDQGENQSLMANVLYVASAAALGTGIGLWVWDTMDTPAGDVAAPSEDVEEPADKPTATPLDTSEDDLLL